jgi:hypothetical protein
MITQEVFDKIVDMFKNRDKILSARYDADKKSEDMIELMQCGVCTEKYENPWKFMADYFKYNKEIIVYLNSVDENWCKKYNYDNENPTIEGGVKFPDIYLDFKDYVDNLNNENYLKCKIIKDKIFKY